MSFSAGSVATTPKNSTYTNPILPGWHSDPSCTFVPEEDNTFFCTTSSFLTFPGIPVYASKDLIHWKLVSNVVTRPEQVPEIANSTSQTQQDGLWASTIRYRKGKFYLLTSYVSMVPTFKANGLLFTTTDIYSDNAWSDPIRFHIGDIDPDIFWDDDGIAYVSYAGISQQTIDLETGATGPATKIWAGSGGRTREGPHIYKKDGWYYLCIGEGGTELDHRQTIARSRNVTGPFEGYSGNPILTNANTTEYFQTVGHADLFHDSNGKWWGIALATRSGPAWRVYPMGRETVLFPVTWKEGEWPILEPVRGEMSGWKLPQPRNKKIPGDGAHTYFTYSVDVSFTPTTEGEEAGVTIFLTQYQHIDLGIVMLPFAGKLVPHIRFQTTLLDDLNTQATQNVTVPETVVKTVPSSSKEVRARLQIQAVDDTHYILSATAPGFDDFKFSQKAEVVLQWRIWFNAGLY
ncbi:predicted protein [Aspergillus terreus NIH2624]|uniref:Beta-xylosidase C-terminal Concanavalin A-like domain-containing protein n=1 Tax=Aspergillus terreus (strain NIH 2624 / FGSC A1156) TaxID=341663 RepID=Q0CFL7_ASPTN|nr:uncharacterized protein ATEG_07517 [Aspergillus terreus NIH2624]EAU31779.1 predicted protein [Aspergillus terreus NIH2624]